ncbi:hypothetical protein FPV67DRAFT_458285 [Lyophyllum atratum]|nr:hypothetical protein FPV67DRAFT_458285 [Lyophyllum atratum]
MSIFQHGHNITLRDDVSISNIQGNYNTIINGSAPRKEFEQGLAALFDVISHGAVYNSKERHPPPRYRPGTHEQTYNKIMDWIDRGYDREAGPVLWLHGPVDAGKSGIAQTICECRADRLAASFFFSRKKPARNTSTQLFPTIAYQLAMYIPGHRSKVNDAIESDLMILHHSMHHQIQKLIIDTFQLGPAAPEEPSLVLIDGLDECGEDGSQTEILAGILAIVQADYVSLRFIVVSRPDPLIRAWFDEGYCRHLTYELDVGNLGLDSESYRELSGQYQQVLSMRPTTIRWIPHLLAITLVLMLITNLKNLEPFWSSELESSINPNSSLGIKELVVGNAATIE